MRIHIYTLLIVLLGVTSIEAQIGINTNNPDPSAILEINGNNGGLLIPRGNFNQRMNIPVSKPGLLFYDVSLDRMMITRVWNDTMLWMPIGPIWQENANALFIDTPFLKKVGIGTSSPEALLHVAGKSIFNDTMLLSGHLRADNVFVPGRTYTFGLDVEEKAIFNDTMLAVGLLQANEMEVLGKTSWNDTMLLTSFLDAQDMKVRGKAIFNDTMLVSHLKTSTFQTISNALINDTLFAGFQEVSGLNVQGVSSFNDTMLLQGFLNADEMKVQGRAIFNDTMLVSNLKTMDFEVQGNGLINDTLFTKGFLIAEEMEVNGPTQWNDTMLVFGLFRANEMEVFGPTRWNDTMLLTGLLDAQDIKVQGNALFNDTILAKNLVISDDLIVNGPTQWNDTMLVFGLFRANEMEVFGPTRWNDTMLLTGLLDAQDIKVQGNALFNDTILAKNLVISDDLIVNGPTQWNDTMLLTSLLDAEEIEVQGKAIFNDTILVAAAKASSILVTGDAAFSNLQGDGERPLAVMPDGKLGIWNDTMMVAFSALNCKSNFPINTQFDANQITAGLTTDQSGSAMWLPLEFPRNGQLLDSLFVTFLDASPMNMTFSMMEMKSNGSGMQMLESVTTTGNVPGTIRTVAIDFDNDSETIDPTSIYLLRVTSTNWSSGTQRILGGYLRLVGG